MILGHVMGLPIEESVVPFVPAGVAFVSVLVVVGRSQWQRMRDQLWRR